MHFRGRLVVAIIGALGLHAQTACAVDITGTWTLCLSAAGAFCAQTLTGVLESAGGLYTLEVADQAIGCTISGSVDPTTGELSVDQTDCAFFNGMSATATDTSITGAFNFFLCPSYTIAGAKVCGTCDDGSPCTVDGCGATPCSPPSSPCTYGQNNGGPCEDGDPCTVGGFCNEGSCASFPKLCNDLDPCTNDTCQAGTGSCIHTPNSNSCNDCQRAANSPQVGATKFPHLRLTPWPRLDARGRP